MPPLRGIRGVKRAFVKFHAFAQTFDEAEAVVVHRGLHHRQHVIGIRGRGARDERGAGGDGLFQRVDGIIHRAPLVGLALESERRRGRGLFFRQAINPVVHDHIGQLDVFARGVGEMVAADGKRVAVAAENKHVQIRPGKRNAAWQTAARDRGCNARRAPARNTGTGSNSRCPRR